MKCSRPLLAILGVLAAAPALGHGDHADATLPNATLPGVARNALIEAPEIVDCTLENGTETSCYSLTVRYLPDGLEIGPFCPATLSDEGGIWDWTGENAGLYRIDEAFLRMLDGLGYRFFDDDGTVHTVDNAVERPQVDHACINVSEDADVTITMLIPVEPVMAETPSLLGVVNKVGVALDGVPIFSDAPSIQQTGHMPALDVCGGHVDPGGWYHWHATSTDIETVFETEGVEADCALEQNASAQFGYAFDGFPMFGSLEPDGSDVAGLDACNGHVGQTPLGVTYHYHASEDFPNLPSCLVGVQAQDNFVTTASAGVGALNAGDGTRNEPPQPGPDQIPPGFEDAARTLGVPTDRLMQVLRESGDGRPDLAAASAALGLSEEDLRTALPPPPQR